ncbi:MAG: HD domain protein [uncultured Gemmatimonadaceae bacterium]|uniref:HD domain protein n=1 Tax=uncultured Gemmatimonadaceae bacterium TaxID=246130 RepID=A0A6J4KAK1_9BACT|nr:MAG: HD domain protein [uncultured Gemmatimonadaceae bacterium]
MSDPVDFLNSFAQTIAAMRLYPDGHPRRIQAVDSSYTSLQSLCREDPSPRFSFLGDGVVYGTRVVREMADWDWSARLAAIGMQRVEFPRDPSRDDYEHFLDQTLDRLNGSATDTALVRSAPAPIRFGALGVRGVDGAEPAPDGGVALPTATMRYSLAAEAEAVQWVHAEVSAGSQLPLVEAEAVVRSLLAAMHGAGDVVLPLVQLRSYDEYTTTHSLNVAVLVMALAEHLGLASSEVRAYGVAGLLHDLGKVCVPVEILNKPGKLTDAERGVMQAHPREGARLILRGDARLDLAAVVAYEHHVMLNGGGYPRLHYGRACHRASALVHVCDVYDALRTKRPYRDAWLAEDVLAYLQKGAGTEFDPDVVRAFVEMMRRREQRPAEL